MSLLNRPKRDLAQLAAAFAPKTGGDAQWKKFFPFWKAPVDSTSVVRFLPDLSEDNGMGFLVENLTHELVINGKRETFACAEMYGEKCPICALSRDYYDKKSANHNELLGKKYYRKKNYIGQALVLTTPVEHDQEQLVKLVEFGPAVFKTMQADFTSGDLDNAPYEVKGGYDFRFKKTQAGQYASYTTSSFSKKMTDISDEVLAKIELYNLSDFRAPKVSYEVLINALEREQSGGDPLPATAPVSPGNDSGGAAVPGAELGQPVDEASFKKPQGTAATAVMEQLRQRRSAKTEEVAPS